jgi:deazaflavin-dependent oxidoreductase (nitroreductase family)
VIAPRSASTPAREIEAQLFRTLNKIIEAPIRKGLGSPPLAPGGLIVLETKGRRSGRRSRVPLAAIRVGDHVLVGTFRGDCSQWIKNLEAEPNVRTWLGGRPRKAKATVIPPGRPSAVSRELPAAVRGLLPFLVPYTLGGWAFAFLRLETRSSRTATSRSA